MTDQKHVGDQGDAMAVGYAAAAERIELEVGAPSGNCLDVGCNTGAGMQALAARWPDTLWFGLEPVQSFALQAKARGFSVGIAEAEAVPFRDGFFDFVFSRHSLEHVRDRAGVIAELLRVLRPGGRLYVQAPIEPGGSPNELHRSAFCSHRELRCAFGPAWREAYWGPQPTVAELILEKLTDG